MQLVGETWVVREYRVEYLLPAFSGEEIEIKTWVENIRRVRSLRRYEFIRKTDCKVLVKGETAWVFVMQRQARRSLSLRKCPKYSVYRKRNNFRVN